MMTPPPRRSAAVPIALGVLAVLLAGLAIWAAVAAGQARDDADRLRAEAARSAARVQELTEGLDPADTALADPQKTTELIDQLRPILEKALSYDYTDLDSTARAVQENLAGRALCEHEQLFGQVRELAPGQRLVLSTQVREIGVSRLEGDRAVLLVFLDQRTTRADQNQTTASGSQLGVRAERQDGRWKVTQFDYLGQPLPNGRSAPQC